MPSAPYNPQDDTTIEAVAGVVYLGDEDGFAPTEDDEATDLRILSIVRSAGGARRDEVRLAVDLGKDGRRIQDVRTPEKWDRQVQARLPFYDKQRVAEVGAWEASWVIGWGAVSAQTVQIDDRNEAAILTARVEPWHFGGPLTGMRVRDPRTGSPIKLDMDPVFNPLVDGVIINNRSAWLDATHDYYYWTHPESVRTTTAIASAEEENRSAWTLASAVHTLCWLLNADETWIKNPTRDELIAAVTDHDPPSIQNLWIKRGLYLHQYLDALLHPHGFDWFLALSTDENSDLVRKISVFKKGEGRERAVYAQAIGEERQATKTSLASVEAEWDIGSIANKIYGFGGYEEREITLPLYRGWPNSDDALTAEDLDKTWLAADGGSYEDHPKTWRMWVANEGGDWTDTRTDITEEPDLGTVFEVATVRRRRIYDRLQKDSAGNRVPPLVERYDPETTTWVAVPSGEYSLLPDQIGVMFNGQKPPDWTVIEPESIELRITGTVVGDARLFKQATRRDESPNGNEVILFLDVSDRFHDRSVQTEGDFASVSTPSPFGRDERDDGDDLQSYVDAARDTEDAANITVSLPLVGLHFDYEIGDLITKVEGRNIVFDRLSQATTETRYLQITAISWEFAQQRTQLYVQPVDDTGYLRDAEFGGPFGRKLRRI